MQILMEVDYKCNLLCMWKYSTMDLNIFYFNQSS
jgi:hypothetical protein